MANDQDEDIMDSLFSDSSAKQQSQSANNKQSKQKKVSKGSVLSSAITELEGEIKSLTQQKEELRRFIAETSSNISNTRKKEAELQKILTILADKEMKLSLHRKNLQNKSDSLTEKLGKASKIMSEMKDL